MMVFGLTGGIGTGKSAAASQLVARGLSVIDTDVIARQIVEPGQPALAEIRRVFGPDVFDDSGVLQRKELACRVFKSTAARHQLEEILHPRIREIWHRQVAIWRAEGKAHAVVVIPLLFETGAEPAFDATICMACTAATQQARLSERGWDAAEIAGRLAAQWPLTRKMDLARYVVWTEGPLAVLEEQMRRVIP